jgi:hypothetical protein
MKSLIRFGILANIQCPYEPEHLAEEQPPEAERTLKTYAALLVRPRFREMFRDTAFEHMPIPYSI